MHPLLMNTPWPLFAFDNHFDGADRCYPTPERWDWQKKLGYDLGYLSIDRAQDESWQKLSDAPAQMARTGLGLAAAYTVVNLTDPTPSPGRTAAAMLELVPAGAALELAITVGWRKELSDPRRDAEVLSFLHPLVRRARERRVTISLYPHYGFWMERVEDCIRLAERMNDPALRVSFSGYHWYAVDGKDLEDRLRRSGPWLHIASVCGAHPKEEGRDYPLPAVIEPVGRGDFPLHEFIAGLRAVSYAGPVGFQGYLIGGHPPGTLRESIAAFRRAL